LQLPQPVRLLVALQVVSPVVPQVVPPEVRGVAPLEGVLVGAAGAARCRSF